LELCGSDPFIVLESADLETAVLTAVTARILNNGESCIAAQRFILTETIADKFEKLLLEKFHTLKIGDPLVTETDIALLATPDILQDLDQQVKIAIESGGKVLTGGSASSDIPRNFYPPTIIIDIPLDYPIAKEKFFGPVALLFRVPDINVAIRLSNDIPFGLGASPWTNNGTEKNRFI
jgi:succinate-semialdehyde dehydrogenase/glutarate-semialdehyde dehydrogenase